LLLRKRHCSYYAEGRVGPKDGNYGCGKSNPTGVRYRDFVYCKNKYKPGRLREIDRYKEGGTKLLNRFMHVVPNPEER
jgi:hypothetical protein